MKAHRSPLLAVLAAIAMLAAGCSSPAGLEEPELSTQAQPSASAADEEVTETVTKDADPGDGDDNGDSNEGTKKKKRKGSGTCASLPKDPRHQYADGTAPGRMPTVEAGSDFNYWIADIENHYDPCAEVSWVLFHGETGSPESPAMTAGARADGVAFYINGEPDGEMRAFAAIEDISVDGDTVEFSWGERTGYTADGITAHYSVTLTTENGRIEAVDGEVGKFNRVWDEPSFQYMLGTYD